MHLSIGHVLAPLSAPVPLATVFQAQILVFDVQTPIIAGTTVSFSSSSSLTDKVELFHHSVNVSATITKLLQTLDKGVVVKSNPRWVRKLSALTSGFCKKARLRRWRLLFARPQMRSSLLPSLSRQPRRTRRWAGSCFGGEERRSQQVSLRNGIADFQVSLWRLSRRNCIPRSIYTSRHIPIYHMKGRIHVICFL